MTHRYSVTVACPNCGEETTFVVESDDPVALDRSVPLTGRRYCPECGVWVYSAESGGWDILEEHEIERLAPTQERGE